MINRHPHTATIKISSQTDSNNDGIPETTNTTINIKGRYEPTVGNGGADNNLNYKAVFYVMGRLDILDSDNKALDGQKLTFNGSDIGIAKAWNYQTHSVIWLD